jgi:membrane protein implicated in regulation of membrane protease activity
MTEMTRALGRALASAFQPKMLLLAVWPIAVSLLLWTILALLFGARVASWLQRYLTDSPLGGLTSGWSLFDMIAPVLSWVVVIVLFVPLVLATATLIIGIISMPAMVEHVARRDYPQLERKHGGTFVGSLWNGVTALVIFVILSVLSLPLWFVPLFWPIIPVLLFGYLNQRVFRYDAASEHASVEERRRLFGRYGASFYALGVLLALAAQVPVIGMFVPVLAGLTFIHYCLDRLNELRRAQTVATA